MKLVIEIGDYERDGVLNHWTDLHIKPADKCEGMSVQDKAGQTKRFARLIDLSEALKKTIEEFYQDINSLETK